MWHEKQVIKNNVENGWKSCRPACYCLKTIKKKQLRCHQSCTINRQSHFGKVSQISVFYDFFLFFTNFLIFPWFLLLLLFCFNNFPIFVGFLYDFYHMGIPTSGTLPLPHSHTQALTHLSLTRLPIAHTRILLFLRFLFIDAFSLAFLIGMNGGVRNVCDQCSWLLSAFTSPCSLFAFPFFGASFCLVVIG